MRRIGWRNESYRHALAAKGISTRYYARTKIPYVATVEGKALYIDPSQRFLVGQRSLPVPIDPKAIAVLPLERRNIIEEKFVVKSGTGDPIFEGQLALLDGNPVIVEKVEKVTTRETRSPYDVEGFERAWQPGLYVKLKESTRPENNMHVVPERVKSVYDAEGNTLSIGQDVLLGDKTYYISKYAVSDGEPVLRLTRTGEEPKVVFASAVRGIKAKAPEKKGGLDETGEVPGEYLAKKGFIDTTKREGVVEYVRRNTKSNVNGDKLEMFKKGVKETFFNYDRDLDNEWKEYNMIAGTKDRLSSDKMLRAEQRGAVIFGRVATQANVEPLLDKEQNRTFRETMMDIGFGRRL